MTNLSIYKLTKITQLVKRARMSQLQFVEHFHRLPVEEPCREYALYVPKQGKRKPGRVSSVPKVLSVSTLGSE